MYGRLNARYIIDRVRANVDRIPISGSSTDRDEDVLEHPSRTISSEAILQWMYQAEVEVARNCKAMYLPDLQSTYQGSLSGFDQSLMLRLQQGRVERQEAGVWYPCNYRSLGESNYMERSAGRAATPQKPAYTYENGRVNVLPGPDPTVRIRYVGYPIRLDVLGVPSQPAHLAGPDDLPFSWALAGAIEAITTASAQRSLRRAADHNLWRGVAEYYMLMFRRELRLGEPEEYGRKRVDEPDENTEF
jgi:hypothetical protein